MFRLGPVVLALLATSPDACSPTETSTENDSSEAPVPDCAVVGTACFCDRDEPPAPAEQLVLNCPQSMSCCYVPTDVACACVAPTDYGYNSCAQLIANFATTGVSVTPVDNCAGY
jgi:hypothetical protein